MSALTKGIFGKFAAPIALGIGAAATAFIPAAGIAQTMQAQPAAANANVRQVAFQTIDGSTRSIRVVQAGASEASRDKIAIIVWGGSRELQQQAYNAALDLRDQGVPLAFIVGPSRLPNDGAVMIDIYGRGVSATQMLHGKVNVGTLRGDLRAQAQAAYGRMFPRELAALDVR